MTVSRAFAVLLSVMLALACASVAQQAEPQPAAAGPRPATLPDGEQFSIDGDLGYSIQVLFANDDPNGRQMVTLIHDDLSVTENGQILPLKKGYTLNWRTADGQTYKITGQPAIALKWRDRPDDPRILEFAFAVDSLDGVPKAILDRKAAQLARNKGSVYASGRLPKPADGSEAPYVIWICKLRVIVTSMSDVTTPTAKGKMYNVSAPSIEFMDWGA